MKKKMFFEIPAHVKAGFKMACDKNHKTMTKQLITFMVGYAVENDTYQEAIDQQAADEMIEDLLSED